MVRYFRKKQHRHVWPESLHLSRERVSGISSQLKVADHQVHVMLQKNLKRPLRTPSSQYPISVLFEHKTAEVQASLFVIDTQNGRSRWSSQHTGPGESKDTLETLEAFPFNTFARN